MTPETISFAAHRWSALNKARGADGAYLTRLSYGVGRVCASAVYYSDHVAAMMASTAWLVDGVEPRVAETLRGLPPIADEQVEAHRFEMAARRLEVRT